MALYDLEVRINGDSSGFQRAVTETQNGVNDTEQAVEQLDRALEESSETAAGAFSESASSAAAASSAFSEISARAESASSIVAAAAAEAVSALNEIAQAEPAVTAASEAVSNNILAISESASDTNTAAESLTATISETQDAAESLSETLSEVSDVLAETETNAEGAERSTSGLENALGSAGSGISRTRESVSGLGDTFDDTAGSADGAAESIGRFGLAIGKLALTQKAIRSVLDCFKEYADYESSVIRTSDIFGEHADAITEFAQTTGKAMGMAESSAYEYAATYGNLFKSITADSEENSQVTIAMLSASATIASKTGRTMEDVMERIRSGLLGNTEAIEDLGIYVNVAMIETTEAFKKIADGRSWEQLEYQEQQQIRTLAILEQANNQFGTGVSQNTVTSLSTLSGAFSDLKVSIGELASGGLTPLVQSLTVVVQGINSAVRQFGALSGTSKTYLGIAAALAIGIPAVTLATKGLALAQIGLQAIQAILIPQTITFGAVLKSAFGWLSIAALAIGVLYAVMGGKNSNKTTDNINEYSNALKNTQKNVDETSRSIDDVKKSTEELANETKKALAGFDELNILNSSGDTSNSLFGFDTSGIDEAQKALGAFSDMDYDINFDTNAAETTYGIKGLFSTMWSDIKTGFKDWTKWWEGLGEDMYTGIHDGDWEPLLTRLDKKVRQIFGDDWSEFWQEAGANMYTGVEEGDWEPLLTQFDDWMRRKFGDRWSDFWQEKGEQIYDGFHTGSTTSEKILNGLDTIIRFTTFGQRWSDFWQDRGRKMYDAFEKAKNDINPVFAAIYAGAEFVFGSDWTSFWEEVGGDIYDAINGNSTEVYNALVDLNDKIRALFGEDWTNFWEGVGEAIYDAFNPEEEILADSGLELHAGGGGYRGSAELSAPQLAIEQIVRSTNGMLSYYQSDSLIPKAATGGIVTKPTKLIAGENGDEAIIPLENNTGWIDKVAEKISASIPSGTSGDLIVRLEIGGRVFEQAVVRAYDMNKARKGG